MSIAYYLPSAQKTIVKQWLCYNGITMMARLVHATQSVVFAESAKKPLFHIAQKKAGPRQRYDRQAAPKLRIGAGPRLSSTEPDDSKKLLLVNPLFSVRSQKNKYRLAASVSLLF